MRRRRGGSSGAVAVRLRKGRGVVPDANKVSVRRFFPKFLERGVRRWRTPRCKKWVLEKVVEIVVLEGLSGVAGIFLAFLLCLAGAVEEVVEAL